MDQKETLTFEEAYAQLEAAVRRLEEGGLTLEESLALYERGMELAALCASQLDQAELRVRQLMAASTGEITSEPFTGWTER
jgi:exodeoxyribonuclease VII small subunit